MEIFPPDRNPASIQAPGRSVPHAGKEVAPVSGHGETYTPGIGEFKNLLSGAKIVFDGTAADLVETKKLIERLNCSAVVSEHSAGWKGSLLEPLFPCEYTKISFDGGDRMLFLPLQSNVGSFHGISTPHAEKCFGKTPSRRAGSSDGMGAPSPPGENSSSKREMMAASISCIPGRTEKP